MSKNTIQFIDKQSDLLPVDYTGTVEIIEETPLACYLSHPPQTAEFVDTEGHLSFN